ncbi:MAG TPA: PIN domain-containing protein [Desulfobacterales bacterium]|nr:PIN domain-containing protein [Desulfobacterales bacterium]
MKLFLDTNLLLDVLAEREPFYAAAARLWSMAETGQCTALVSAISFNNVFYIVRKARDAQTARRALILLRDVFIGVAPDQAILNQAIDSEIPDFEDAIQFYSAVHAGADYLITRNADDFPVGSLPILDPQEFLALFEL